MRDRIGWAGMEMRIRSAGTEWGWGQGLWRRGGDGNNVVGTGWDGKNSCPRAVIGQKPPDRTPPDRTPRQNSAGQNPPVLARTDPPPLQQPLLNRRM